MNSFESLFWTLGASWQLSVLLPFFILILSGFLCGFLLWRKIKQPVIKWFVLVMIGLFPSTLYFAFYPIYESDIKNDYRAIKLKKTHATSSFDVYVLPNCPYCVQSIETLVKLRKRNPKLLISYKILSSKGNGGDVESDLIKHKIKYSFVSNTSTVRKITKGSFPTFVFHSKNSAIAWVWNNNTFGSKALDFIEDRQN